MKRSSRNRNSIPQEREINTSLYLIILTHRPIPFSHPLRQGLSQLDRGRNAGFQVLSVSHMPALQCFESSLPVRRKGHALPRLPVCNRAVRAARTRRQTHRSRSMTCRNVPQVSCLLELQSPLKSIYVLRPCVILFKSPDHIRQRRVNSQIWALFFVHHSVHSRATTWRHFSDATLCTQHSALYGIAAAHISQQVHEAAGKPHILLTELPQRCKSRRHTLLRMRPAMQDQCFLHLPLRRTRPLLPALVGNTLSSSQLLLLLVREAPIEWK